MGLRCLATLLPTSWLRWTLTLTFSKSHRVGGQRVVSSQGNDAVCSCYLSSPPVLLRATQYDMLLLASLRRALFAINQHGKHPFAMRQSV
jgi:hypothetical protein